MALSQQLYETLRQTTLVSLSPDNTVYFAVQIMSEYRADVLLLKRRGCVVGMVTQRDLAARVSALGRDPEITTLSAVMTATADGETDHNGRERFRYAAPFPRQGSWAACDHA